MRRAEVTRKTRETDISIVLEMDGTGPVQVRTGLPFFDHMLTAMAFHGGFSLRIEGTGDLEVDPHHLVEDTGLVLGQTLRKVLTEFGAVMRYGHSVIPMDDALSEATVDVCERPFLVYRAAYPQEMSGTFPMALLREFFHGLASAARINLHLECRYGENSHHMAEALFKALGRAVAAAYSAKAGDQAGMSTKGNL